MKKYILALATFLFLLNPSLVHAEGSTSSPKPLIQRFQTAKAEVKERVATREGEKRERMNDLRKQIVNNFFNLMFKRFEAAQDRLTKILTRIESRVAKIKTENPTKDLTKVDAEIASVKTALNDNQTKIDTLKTNFETALASDTPKEKFKTVIGDVSVIKKNLENIRKSLSKIIGEIKGLHVGEDEKESPKP